ncbi:PH domain-like protein [Glonium stellatum]|uniref:PH domain-like protein n=1 Tax=Glonium stellatum TaxID=574774 RepID=A0A8E2EU55_9PEZI|nr:PH domain-like protein [Glonium stellatum]
MASRKVKARAHQTQSLPQPSDYETDAPNLDIPPPPPRSNAELNLSVIQRHNPSVTSVLSIAPYAVVYLFSPVTQAWEKCGIEGTLFVCQLTQSNIGADRYAVMILNRRGLDNFTTELLSGDDVENTEEYVILQIGAEDGTPQIYGLWIFSEPAPSSTANTRTINAQIIQDCATQAEMSRKLLEQELRESNNGAEQIVEDTQTEEESVPMGRQLSLRELFGQQRVQDAGWSVHNHHSPSVKPTQFATTLDTDFFRTASRFTPGKHPQKPQSQSMNTQSGDDSDVIGQLFWKAKQGYRGSR